MAAIVVRKEQVLSETPITRRLLEFFIKGDGAAVVVDLSNPRYVTVRTSEPVFVSSSEGSIVVVAPLSGYFETYFFKAPGSFLEGENWKTLGAD